MRLPWPGHLNLKTVMWLSLVLMVAELLLGTSPLFAAGIFYYIMVAAIAFNIAGGMNTFSGSFIGFMALESIIISQVAKVFYLQAADTHLMTPQTTIAVYDMGITCVALAAAISTKYRRKTPIFNADKDGDRMVGMSIAASLIGMVSLLIVGLYGFADDLTIKKGDVFGYLNQFGGFLPLGVLLGTAYIINKSNGTRSVRWWTMVPFVYSFLFGVAVESKQGIYSPLLTWLVVCAAYGYKLSRKQVVLLIAAGIFSGYIIFPVVQYMRGYTRTGNVINRGKLVYEYLADNNLLDIRENYIATQQLKEEGSSDGYFYYGTDKELLDRVSLIETEDAIIHRTEVSVPRGMKYMSDGFLGMVPRALWPGKARWEAGAISQVNEMGREIGMLSPTDETTFISFSMFGSTFYMVGWWGTAPLILAVMIPFFWLLDSFYGSIKTNLYCLFPVVINMHGAPEFTLPAVFAAVVHAVLLTAITIWFIRFVSPAVTIFLARHGMLESLKTAPPPAARPPLAPVGA